MQGGKAVFGALVLDHPAGGGEGAARLFVRPHELDIQTIRNGQPALPATVQRILATGPLVKVELSGEAGESINVEMPHERFRETPIALGDRVFVSPRDAKVFVEDYSI